MDGLVPSVTTLISQPQLSQIQQRVQSLCGWKRFFHLSVRTEFKTDIHLSCNFF